MRKTILIAAVLFCSAGALYAATVYCPLHLGQPCYDTGLVSRTGSNAHKWHCSCGDDVWISDPLNGVLIEDTNAKEREAEERAEERSKKLAEAVDKNTKAIKEAAWNAQVRQMQAQTAARIAEDEALLAHKPASQPAAAPISSQPASHA